MTEFPSLDADELVTRQFLRAELAELENRLTVRAGAALGVVTAILAALITAAVAAAGGIPGGDGRSTDGSRRQHHLIVLGVSTRRALLTLRVLALLCTGTVQALATHEDASAFHYVTVSDGTEIAVQVFLPPGYVDGETYPVLFTMDGYGGAGGGNDSTFDHDHDGYVLVAASLRGTGCSGGQLDLFDPRASQDGAEIIEDWRPTQDWYDPDAGVGIFGHSYAGLTGFLVAAESPEGLKAVAVSGLIDDFYRGPLPRAASPTPASRACGAPASARSPSTRRTPTTS